MKVYYFKKVDPQTTLPVGSLSLLYSGKNLKVYSLERVKQKVSGLRDRMNN